MVCLSLLCKTAALLIVVQALACRLARPRLCSSKDSATMLRPAYLPSHTLRWNSLNTMTGQCCMLVVVSTRSMGASHTTPDSPPSSGSSGHEACVRPCSTAQHSAAQRACMMPCMMLVRALLLECHCATREGLCHGHYTAANLSPCYSYHGRCTVAVSHPLQKRCCKVHEYLQGTQRRNTTCKAYQLLPLCTVCKQHNARHHRLFEG